MREWREFVDAFHDERAGAAADLLSRCLAGGESPLRWLARSVSDASTKVLDIGCGAGSMTRVLAREQRTVVGLDLSEAELHEAARRGGGPWVRADAMRLPIATGSIDAVVTSMGLAVIQPTESLLDEIARVMRPGGMFAGTVPTYRPVNRSDMALMSRLAWLLGGPPRFPVRLNMSLGPLLMAHGLRKVEDARERYYFSIRTRADAHVLLRALYLPSASDSRIRRTEDWLTARAEECGPVKVPIPFRRVVAIK